MRHCYRRGIQRVAQALFNLEVPMIAAINEHAMGAGLDLACLCDIQVASDKAKTLMAISNSPTRGHPKFPQAARSDYDGSALIAMRAAASLSL